MTPALKLYVVATSHDVEHLVTATSDRHAIKRVAEILGLPKDELSARMLSDLTKSQIVRSVYPNGCL